MIETLAAVAITSLAFLIEWLIWRAVATVRTWRITLPRWTLPDGPERNGRVMAYALLAGGTLATVAANYAHAHANIGAKLLSAVVPVLLFVAFHVAAKDGRWLIRATTGAVALLCFAISYDHISALATSYGEKGLSPVLYPLAIDGAMIVATFVLSRPARTEDKPVVLSETPKPVREPVRPKRAVLSETPKPVLSAVPEDSPRTNGFVRPMPPVRPKREDSPADSLSRDSEARLTAARKIAEELGDGLNRAALVERLKKQGYRISTQAAADLTRELKAARS